MGWPQAIAFPEAAIKKNSNMVVEGGTVSHYYILVNRKFIYFMSLFRHSVWFSFSVKQFPSADFGVCNICSSVQADFYWFSLYSFHNFSLRFILKIFLKFRKFKLPYSYKALRVYLLPIDLTLAAFPTHGPDRWIRQQSRNVPPRSPSVIKV